MSETKKIILSLADDLLNQVDEQSKEMNMNRSEWIRRAVVSGLETARKEKIRRQMEEGYREMGLINLELAEESLAANNSDFAIYEKKILESE